MKYRIEFWKEDVYLGKIESTEKYLLSALQAFPDATEKHLFHL